MGNKIDDKQIEYKKLTNSNIKKFLKLMKVKITKVIKKVITTIKVLNNLGLLA